MEFNEKLYYLRKQHSLTQEQLAEKLYVSRTAVSKWEQGKGYPSIESLKSISKLFDITIDELLSSDELIAAAETENHANLKKVYTTIIGLLDVFAIAFILLPLYGNVVDGVIYPVNLYTFTSLNVIIRIAYWAVFLVLIATGILELVFVRLDKEEWSIIGEKVSFILSIIAILLFATTKEPYVVILLFLMFLAKLFLLMKQSKLR